MRLGFTEMDAETAVQGVGQPSLPACLDWLCLHLPEEDLPPAFAPGHPPSLNFPYAFALAYSEPELAVLAYSGSPLSVHPVQAWSVFPCTLRLLHATLWQ